MPEVIDKGNMGNLKVQLGTEDGPRLDLTIAGKTVSARWGPELHIDILPRDIRTKMSSVAGRYDWTTLVSTGTLPDGLCFATQRTPDRTRDLKLYDPNRNKVVTVQGFGIGLIVEDCDGAQLVIGPPEPGQTIEQYDNLTTGTRTGTLYYTTEGEEVHDASQSPLGGITPEALQAKIPNTQEAKGYIGKRAHLPDWVAQGELEVDNHVLGWGVYELPNNIPLYQLAEMLEAHKANGVQSDLYEDLVFKTMHAIRALHSHDRVHLQLHLGNLSAAFNGKGSITPVITDWETMVDISQHRMDKLIDNGSETPKQMNLIIDLGTALKNLMDAYITYGIEHKYNSPRDCLDLLPARVMDETEYEAKVLKITAAALAGYLAPDEYNGQLCDLTQIEAYIKHFVEHNPLFQEDSMFNNLDAFCYHVASLAINGTQPYSNVNEPGADAFNHMCFNFVDLCRISLFGGQQRVWK